MGQTALVDRRFVVPSGLDGRRLGRVNGAEEATDRYGAAAMSEIFDGFLEYDELAQAAMDDFHGIGGGQRMLHEALDHGIESVGDAPESLRALFAQVDQVPEWVDWDQLRRGSIAYWRPGPLVSFVFTTAAVVGGDRGYGITRPQTVTGRFIEHAYTRSAETFRWLMAAAGPDGMHRFSDGFKLTVQVRMLHAAVRHGVVASAKWDWEDWGTPISRSDQIYSLTFAFSTVMMDAFSKLGVRYSDREIEDIYALWRYIGWVMGVDPAAPPLTTDYCVSFNERWRSVDPGPDDKCRALIHSLIELATPEDPSSGPSMDVFPSIVTKVMPPLRLRAFMYGLVRFLLGDESGDAVHAPDTAWKHAGHVIRPAIGAWELRRSLSGSRLSRRRLAGGDERVALATIDLFGRVLGAKPGESVVATPSDVAAAVAH